MSSTAFEERIGYTFKDPALLRKALTHSSATNENTNGVAENNERLEFLGDAVFDVIISEYLYHRMTDVEEGQLSKLRALVVCERSLSECGKRLRINEELRLGRGEELNGGRNRSSILADAMEAVIGAVYLDGGFEAAASFVLSAFNTTIDMALSGMLYRDFKTELQEFLQAQKEVEIRYLVDREEGPDHDKTFYVSLWDGKEKLGEGAGKTKKEAEQNAAKAALEGYGVVF
ncbi:MAG: ribonuclease III [Anaerovoracaceae bacterium]